MRDPISPSLRRIMELQEKYNRQFMGPVRMAEKQLALAGVRPPFQQSMPAIPKNLSALAGVQSSLPSDLLAARAALRSPLADLRVPYLGAGMQSSKMLQQLMGTPLVTPLLGNRHKFPALPQTIIRADNFLAGRATWADSFTPRALDFIGQATEQLERMREQDKRINKDTEAMVKLFQQEGWHILPILYYSDFLLPVILSRAAERSFDEAKQVLLSAMQACQADLLDYINEKLGSLGVVEERLEQRRHSIERQFRLACGGENVDGVASFMVAEAEGLFNEVTARLGLEKGSFYTSDPARIQRRTELLDKWHQQIKNSNDLFDEDYTRRHLKMFTKTRAKTIPKRDEMQHGELGYRTQESALWASTFLILTVEYLSALARIVTE